MVQSGFGKYNIAILNDLTLVDNALRTRITTTTNAGAKQTNDLVVVTDYNASRIGVMDALRNQVKQAMCGDLSILFITGVSAPAYLYGMKYLPNGWRNFILLADFYRNRGSKNREYLRGINGKYPNEPQYKQIRNSGHAGGDFIFARIKP